jgi:Lipocalin-like domain
LIANNPGHNQSVDVSYFAQTPDGRKPIIINTIQFNLLNRNPSGRDTVRPDGSRVPTFGSKATGILIFGSDGRFIYLFSRAELPKFASNNRNTGTPEENTAVVKGSIATSGTYSVADKIFTIKIEHSTFPNWIGAEQTRTITVTGDEMKWSNPAGSGGGVVELVLKRVK